MRKTLFAATLVMLPLLAACGSDTESAPEITQADLSTTFQDMGIEAKFADCAAKVYVEEGLSQAALQLMVSEESDAMVGNPESLGMAAEDADKARGASAKIASQCLGQTQ